MTLKILLPFRVFSETTQVSRLVVETRDGSLGFLPHRLDCVTDLVPGILTYQGEGPEVILAVDQGVLVKIGEEILVSVRNALEGEDLAGLRDAVERQFLQVDHEERQLREVMSKLETGFLRRLGQFHHG